MKTQLNVTHIFFLSDLPKLPGKFTLTKKGNLRRLMLLNPFYCLVLVRAVIHHRYL